MTPLDTTYLSDFDFIIKHTQNQKGALTKPRLQFGNLNGTETDAKQQLNTTQENPASKAFYPIILICKFIGFLPVKISRIENGGYNCSFKWLSKQFIITLIFGLAAGFLLGQFILNGIFKIDWPLKLFKHLDSQPSWISEKLFRGSDLLLALNKTLRIFLPVGSWFSLILSWSDVPSFCKFINEWPIFIRQYNDAFGPYYTPKFNLARQRNINCVFWLTPSLILVLFVKPASVVENDNIIFGVILAYSQIFTVLGTRAVSYVKDFLLLETVKGAYAETLNGIKAEYGKCGKEITREQVRQWMDLVGFIRMQVGRMESHISCQNLWSVFEIFISVLVILSMGVFLFMNDALGGSLTGNFLPFSGICTTFFICSLYWKTDLAEQITNAEEGIADELIEMETADDDCETRLEVTKNKFTIH